MKYVLLTIVLLLIAVYLLSPNTSYDLSKVQNHNGCYSYTNDDDIINIAASLVKENYGEDELKHQRKLSIHRKEESEIEVVGYPLSPYIQRFMFGGGGVVVDFERKNQCLILYRIYQQK